MSTETESGHAIDPLDLSAETVNFDVLNDTLSNFIRIINVAVSRDWEARIQDLPAVRGIGKVWTLFLIHNHPGIRPSTLATLSLRDRSDIARLLDALEKDGLIRRVTSPADSRAWELHLTAAGEALVVELRDRMKASRQFVGDVDDEDYTMLMQLLRKVYWKLVSSPRPTGITE
jgi:DNA-binding MarR family transcriptional regulator